jgi:hypothetical protein
MTRSPIIAGSCFALKPIGRDPFGVHLFLSINTSNGNVYGDDVVVDDYLLER